MSLGSLQDPQSCELLPKELRKVLYNYHSGVDFTLHTFQTQVVQGLMYHVKFSVDGMSYLGKVLQHFDKTVELIEVVSEKN